MKDTKHDIEQRINSCPLLFRLREVDAHRVRAVVSDCSDVLREGMAVGNGRG